MPHSPSPSRPRRTPAFAVVAGVLGLLSYLFLPALHAVHAPGATEVHAASHAVAHACHHDHHHVPPPADGHPDDDQSPAPAHDSESCGVCQAFSATHAGTALPAPLLIVVPSPRAMAVTMPPVDQPRGAPALPACPPRGPPVM